MSGKTLRNKFNKSASPQLCIFKYVKLSSIQLALKLEGMGPSQMMMWQAPTKVNTVWKGVYQFDFIAM